MSELNQVQSLTLCQSAIYEIKVQGLLHNSWTQAFDNMAITTNEETGITTLTGRICDQTALHGLLQRINHMALPLLAVTCISTTSD